MRVMDGFSAGALLLAATLVYYIKTDTREMRADERLLERELQAEREKINVLQAEIAHLENPDRLRRLAKQYLDLKPYDGTHTLESVDLASLRRSHVLPEKEEGAEEHFADRTASDNGINMAVFKENKP